MKQYQAIIIDDERNIREALTLLLGEYCPEIKVCGFVVSAQEGRELLKTHEVDFIFLDISMPKEDGFAFLRSIDDRPLPIPPPIGGGREGGGYFAIFSNNHSISSRFLDATGIFRSLVRII